MIQGSYVAREFEKINLKKMAVARMQDYKAQMESDIRLVSALPDRELVLEIPYGVGTQDWCPICTKYGMFLMEV